MVHLDPIEVKLDGHLSYLSAIASSRPVIKSTSFTLLCLSSGRRRRLPPRLFRQVRHPPRLFHAPPGLRLPERWKRSPEIWRNLNPTTRWTTCERRSLVFSAVLPASRPTSCARSLCFQQRCVNYVALQGGPIKSKPLLFSREIVGAQYWNLGWAKAAAWNIVLLMN